MPLHFYRPMRQKLPLQGEEAQVCLLCQHVQQGSTTIKLVVQPLQDHAHTARCLSIMSCNV